MSAATIEQPLALAVRDGDHLRLVACPFCGARHEHRGTDGARVAHCGVGRGYVVTTIADARRA